MVSSDDTSAVLAANVAFYAAFEALDLEAMGSLWSTSSPISCIHPRGELLTGRDAVLASWRGIFGSTRSMRFTLRSVRAFVAGDTAWVVLVEQIEAQNGEATLEAETQATNLFLREDGAWRLVHHHAEPATAQKRAPSPPRSVLN